MATKGYPESEKLLNLTSKYKRKVNVSKRHGTLCNHHDSQGLCRGVQLANQIQEKNGSP